jgi:hypothetical protein
MAFREEVALQAVGDLAGINVVVLFLGRCNRSQHQQVPKSPRMISLFPPSLSLSKLSG